ncbi:MAG: integrase [Oceanibulbus sp.]|nr:integrase [Sulfitobacter sp.]
MVVKMNLKHVDELSGGRKRFRRRYPKSLVPVLGEAVFQVAMKAREGGALVSEWESLMKTYDRNVAKAERAAGVAGADDRLSPLELWREARRDAAAMLAAFKDDLTEDERRELLGDELERREADPVLYRAVVEPDAPEPKPTLLDAKNMYLQERLEGGTGRNNKNRLDRVCKRIEATLGPLNKLSLVDLTRDQARTLRDAMLSTRKADGTRLAPASVRRELDMIKAMVSLGIKEFGLQREADNPFIDLPISSKGVAPDVDSSKRDPLPKNVLLAMRDRMREKAQVPALGLIWRLLEGTGCRGAEVVGLRREDVVLDGLYPHINVAWHEDRRVKTKASIRSVPLVGDALVAAREALTLSEGEPMLFPKYARENGPDAASAALMKHLRTVTKNPRHVVYSLRHNMKDWLVLAGTSERVENRIMGHTVGGLGDRVYGGNDAKLKVAYEAMEKAIKGMP